MREKEYKHKRNEIIIITLFLKIKHTPIEIRKTHLH